MLSAIPAVQELNCFADLAVMENLCTMLPGSGRCHLINGAVQLLDSAFHHFHDEFRQALR